MCRRSSRFCRGRLLRGCWKPGRPLENLLDWLDCLPEGGVFRGLEELSLGLCYAQSLFE